jgi:hypothetical protein
LRHGYIFHACLCFSLWPCPKSAFLPSCWGRSFVWCRFFKCLLTCLLLPYLHISDYCLFQIWSCCLCLCECLFCLFSMSSRTAMCPRQAFYPIGNGNYFPWDKAARAWIWSFTSNCCRGEENVNLYIHSPIHLHGIVLNYLNIGTIWTLPYLMSVCLIFPASAVEIVPYKNWNFMSIKNMPWKIWKRSAMAYRKLSFLCQLLAYFICFEKRIILWDQYKYYVSGHYPLSCSYYKTQCFVVSFAWRRRQNTVSETLCVLNKNRTIDNVHKHNICIIIHHSTIRRYIY